MNQTIKSFIEIISLCGLFWTFSSNHITMWTFLNFLVFNRKMANIRDFFQKSSGRKLPKKYLVCISFCWTYMVGVWNEASRLISQTPLIGLHTYTIGHYNPVRIIDLVSHTTYVVGVNFIHKWQDLQFKVDSERQIFWETFHGNFIYSLSFWQKSAERKSP